VRIEQFNPGTDENRLRACHEIASACQRADDPDLPARSFAAFSIWWTHGHNFTPRQAWLATEAAGNPVGCYLLTLPERENREWGMCYLTVPPASRRAGVGTALLEHCAQQARLAGRSHLASEVREGSPGAAFAATAGATMGIAEVLRQLRVDDRLRASLGSLRAEAERNAAGYTVRSWVGATPPQHLADAARVSEAMADAPRDDGMEHEAEDADRIKALEELRIAAGLRSYAVAAWHDQTGEMAALTQLGTEPGSPGWGFQGLTAVLRAHRGHRLGLLVKVAMLQLLTTHEPDVQRILTGNASANKHMIAINEQLGFEVSSVYRSCELDLSAS
jgi:GNAT superfamily N-acetyltransferase/RimJ/RimL family protein N-acetyltransferase